MNPIELQRLMDGELSHDDRARLLRSLGDDVVSWRTIALRLLEEHSLKAHCQDWLDRSMQAPSARSPSARMATAQATSPSQAKSASAMAKRDADGLANARKSLGRTWLNVAASLMLVTLGIATGRQLGNPAGVKQDVQGSNVASAPADRSDTYDREDLIATGRLRMVAGDPANAQPLEAPVYEVQTLDPEMIVGQDLAKWEALNRQLHRKGWRAGLETQLYGAELPDGRRMVVPVNNVNFQPYGL
jgi:hypothetical protein